MPAFNQFPISNCLCALAFHLAFHSSQFSSSNSKTFIKCMRWLPYLLLYCILPQESSPLVSPILSVLTVAPLDPLPNFHYTPSCSLSPHRMASHTRPRAIPALTLLVDCWTKYHTCSIMPLSSPFPGVPNRESPVPLVPIPVAEQTVSPHTSPTCIHTAAFRCWPNTWP